MIAGLIRPLMILAGLMTGVSARGDDTAPAALEAQVRGTWVLQQVSSREELDRLEDSLIAPALSTPAIQGFCLRVPWRAIDQDFALLEAGWELARRHHVRYSVRFMAGRHTPDRVFDSGARFYEITTPTRDGRPRAERVPAPFRADGSPNVVFEDAYRAFVKRLAAWCRAHDVRLLHLAWYGQDWAELNHGKEVRALEGYSYENWLHAHVRLLDIGLECAGEDLAVELPLSGYGPLTDAAVALADHVVQRLGPYSPLFYCQANGWGPRGDWGAPTAAVEAAFDRVWERPIRRGQQAIGPSDFDWASLFAMLVANRATYCEVYAPSFVGRDREDLAREVGRFAPEK